MHTPHANAFHASAHAESFCGDNPASKKARVGNEARHNEGVYLTLSLRHTEIFQTISIKVLNLATVDAPGVIISIRCSFIASHCCTLSGAVYICIYAPRGYDFSYRRGL